MLMMFEWLLLKEMKRDLFAKSQFGFQQGITFVKCL